MGNMKIRVTLTQEMLGTCNSNPDIQLEHVIKKSGDEARIQEELAAQLAATPEEQVEKLTTVFPRMAEGLPDAGKPIMWDYQVKGFLKEAARTLAELTKTDVRIGKSKFSKLTSDRLFDCMVGVYPRRILLHGELGPILTRPLRVTNWKGTRVALASSETMKEGTTFDAEIRALSDDLDPIIEQCLDYGAFKGLLQWRNAGFGRFTWARIES
jgi:hypothetical protein